MKRIAITGKGGTGKTTIAGTLSRLAGRVCGELLAIDGDPNPNLARTIGISNARSPITLGEPSGWPMLPADLIKYEERDGKQTAVLSRSLSEILDTHALAGPDGVRLLTMGEVHHTGRGCLCRSHAIVREVVGAALSAESKGPVLLDMEASLEHMSRGTLRYIDTLLIVTEPYYRSLESAGRLVRLARELGVPHVLGVANKVRNQAEHEAIATYLTTAGIPLVATVPFDEAVTGADLKNQPLLDFAPDGPAVRAIASLLPHVLPS